eukprot:5060603-Prorocentrum_lima.AAC.1
MYFKIVALVRVVVVADAAYRSNEDKSDCSLHPGGHCYVLDSVSKKHATTDEVRMPLAQVPSGKALAA